MSKNKDKTNSNEEKTVEIKSGEVLIEALRKVEHEHTKQTLSGHLWSDPAENNEPETPQEWFKLGIEMGRESSIDELRDAQHE